MAVNANKVRTIVDEVAKFKKEEIEFLFETIKNGMIPGKHLGIAMEVVNKLKSQYQLLNRKEAKIKETKSKGDVVKQQIEDIQQEEKQRLKEQDGELWVEE
jgi:ATP-dependent DNA ligase|tara:strand:+ start:450 stop:752 length:303 start_codon:yes stop_codon:yes gene_type:complete